MVVRRVGSAAVVLAMVTFLVFVTIRLVPGDPITTMLSRASISNPELVAQFRSDYGLDQPIPVQFVVWLRHILTGDFGKSIVSSERVSVLLWSRLSATILLGVVAIILAFSVGIAWGVAATVARGVVGKTLRFAPLLGVTVPSFSIGLAMSFLFAVVLKVLPASGMTSFVGGGGPLDVATHAILPAISLAIFPGSTHSADNARDDR